LTFLTHKLVGTQSNDAVDKVPTVFFE